MVRIHYPENERIPPEGSSTEGKSVPKVRLKSVIDGKLVNIPIQFYVGNKGRSWLIYPENGNRFKSLRR